MSDYTGWIALGITLIYTCLGLGMQLFNNFKKESTEGLSPFMVTTLLATFVSWIVYGALRSPPDFFIILPNVTGGACSAVLLLQILIYRRGRVDRGTTPD